MVSTKALIARPAWKRRGEESGPSRATVAAQPKIGETPFGGARRACTFCVRPKSVRRAKRRPWAIWENFHSHRSAIGTIAQPGLSGTLVEKARRVRPSLGARRAVEGYRVQGLRGADGPQSGLKRAWRLQCVFRTERASAREPPSPRAIPNPPSRGETASAPANRGSTPCEQR